MSDGRQLGSKMLSCGENGTEGFAAATGDTERSTTRASARSFWRTLVRKGSGMRVEYGTC